MTCISHQVIDIDRWECAIEEMTGIDVTYESSMVDEEGTWTDKFTTRADCVDEWDIWFTCEACGEHIEDEGSLQYEASR